MSLEIIKDLAFQLEKELKLHTKNMTDQEKDRFLGNDAELNDSFESIIVVGIQGLPPRIPVNPKKCGFCKRNLYSF